MRSSILLVPLLPSLTSAAGCQRDQLIREASQFFLGAFANAKSDSAVPFTKLSSTAKITQNNQVLGSINESIFGNATGFVKPFRIQAVDTVACDVSSLVVVSERAGKGGKMGPAIVSVRLRIPKEDEVVSEVEILNALASSHALFNVANIPDHEPKEWSKHEVANLSTEAEVKARERLVRVADSYVEGIQRGDSSIVLAAKSCPRLENGVQTTGSCGSGLEMFKWPVTDRRWVVDVETQVVMGSFFFHYRLGTGLMNKLGMRSSTGTTGLWLHEYFKIKDGKIVGIWAAMQTLDYRYKDVWGPAV